MRKVLVLLFMLTILTRFAMSSEDSTSCPLCQVDDGRGGCVVCCNYEECGGTDEKGNKNICCKGECVSPCDCVLIGEATARNYYCCDPCNSVKIKTYFKYRNSVGTVACCAGKKFPCVNNSKNPYDPQDAKHEIWFKAIMFHENFHASSPRVTCGQDKGVSHASVNNESKWVEEEEAYNATYSFLQKIKITDNYQDRDIEEIINLMKESEKIEKLIN